MRAVTQAPLRRLRPALPCATTSPCRSPAPARSSCGVAAAGVDQGVWHLMAGLPLVVRLGFGLRRPKQPVPGLRGWSGIVEAVGGGRRARRRARPRRDSASATGCWASASAPTRSSPSRGCGQAGPRPRRPGPHGRRDAARVRGARRCRRCGTMARVATRAEGPGDRRVGRRRRATRSRSPRRSAREVTGVASAAKADLVRSLGAEDVVDYRTARRSRQHGRRLRPHRRHRRRPEAGDAAPPR